jgi:hypothetical protein
VTEGGGGREGRAGGRERGREGGREGGEEGDGREGREAGDMAAALTLVAWGRGATCCPSGDWCKANTACILDIACGKSQDRFVSWGMGCHLPDIRDDLHSLDANHALLFICVLCRGIDNMTYYMVDPAQYIQLINFSGCGNTVNANHPVVKELIIKSLVHWVEEYHVDGFRFDLASCLCRGLTGEEGGLTVLPVVLVDVQWV